jgi:hypothetical protein
MAAISDVRQAAFALHHLARVSSPMTDWKSRTMAGIRVRAGNCADAVERVFDVGHPVAQRLVHGVFQRRRPDVTGIDLAPSSFMRNTFGACRWTSVAPM